MSVTTNACDALTTDLLDLGLRRATRELAALVTKTAVSYPLGVVNISTTARRITVWTVGPSVSVTRRALAYASMSRARAKRVVEIMTGSVPTALRVTAAGRRLDPAIQVTRATAKTSANADSTTVTADSAIRRAREAIVDRAAHAIQVMLIRSRVAGSYTHLVSAARALTVLLIIT